MTIVSPSNWIAVGGRRRPLSGRFEAISSKRSSFAVTNATPPSPNDRVEADRAALETVFTSSLPDIERIIRAVARRHGISVDEREEFAAEVRLSLVDHEYATLAQFNGNSSLRTYLTTVIQRLFFDYRRRLWGRWRGSAQAKRLGPTAERLELLIYRDGLSIGEACQRIIDSGSNETVAYLEGLARRIPQRERVRVDTVGSMDDVGAVCGDSSGPRDNPHRALEEAQSTARCRAALARALSRLGAHDRVLLRLRYEDGVSVAAIARLSSLDQKELYRHLERLLKEIRVALAGEGIGWTEVSGLVESGACNLVLLDDLAGSGPESGPGRPSILEARS
jgi:RNA polymerase sigma factor (sigma-70 family)